MNILQGFFGVVMGYVQDRVYINPGVYQREFVLYLRYKVKNGVHGILPGLSQVSKQLGWVLGDLGALRATFACLIAGHGWTDRFNPATDSVGGTIDESLVIISRFPKGPPDNLLYVGAGDAIGG